MRRAPGMTLLEVLIATTILASLTVIVSTLWAQTKQWTDEVGTHDSALRLQRALDLLDRQWESRVFEAKLADGESGAARVDESRLEFITTEGVLFPDWPFVRAAYVASPVGEIGEASTTWRLVYEETRLGTVASTETANTPDANRVDHRKSVLAELIGRPQWSAVLTDAQVAEWESTHGSAPTDDAESDQARWINLTEGADRHWAGLESATNPEAVRLDGATTEGGFRWALVGQPLR